MGHDACRYVADELGWLIEGCAVYAEHDRVATLSYRVRCDEAWRSRSASVSGWVGSEALTIDVVHTPGDRWTVNGRDVPELAGLIDIEAEKTRIAKDIVKVDKEIATLEKKLANEAFVSRAPEDVVAEQRARLVDEQTRRRRLEEALTSLQ